MASLRNFLSVLASTALANAAMGPAYSTGPTTDSSWIRESTATLTLPALPSNNRGDLSLWVGMGTSNGDLIQSIAETYDGGAWSVYTYTLEETSPTTQVPVQGPSHSAKPGDKITMHYLYSDSTAKYTQTVSLNGVVVSTLSTSDGHALGWGSAVECAATDCGTIPAHTWTDVKLTLNSAYANYKSTFGKASGVGGGLTTADGGKTWTGSFSIPKFTF